MILWAWFLTNIYHYKLYRLGVSAHSTIMARAFSCVHGSSPLVFLTGLGTHDMVFKHDHSTFQPEQIRYDFTVSLSIVTLKVLSSFGGTIFRELFLLVLILWHSTHRINSLLELQFGIMVYLLCDSHVIPTWFEVNQLCAPLSPYIYPWVCVFYTQSHTEHCVHPLQCPYQKLKIYFWQKISFHVRYCTGQKACQLLSFQDLVDYQFLTWKIQVL